LFIRIAFPRFDFIQYGQHAFGCVLVRVIVIAPLVRLKLLWAVNQHPNLCSCSYSCLCEHSLMLVLMAPCFVLVLSSSSSMEIWK